MSYQRSDLGKTLKYSQSWTPCLISEYTTVKVRRRPWHLCDARNVNVFTKRTNGLFGGRVPFIVCMRKLLGYSILQSPQPPLLLLLLQLLKMIIMIRRYSGEWTAVARNVARHSFLQKLASTQEFPRHTNAYTFTPLVAFNEFIAMCQYKDSKVRDTIKKQCYSSGKCAKYSIVANIKWLFRSFKVM